MFGFSLLQLVDPLDEGAELDFHGPVPLNLHGRLDGHQIGGGCGGSNNGRSVCLLHLERGEDTELLQLFGPELIHKPTEPPKLVSKVADTLMQGAHSVPAWFRPALL